jgi:hypothetical protein
MCNSIKGVSCSTGTLDLGQRLHLDRHLGQFIGNVITYLTLVLSPSNSPSPLYFSFLHLSSFCFHLLLAVRLSDSGLHLVDSCKVNKCFMIHISKFI